MGKKIFKDPIYGYIEIEDDIVKKVIDKPSFQRLRRIIQTSYTPLYASALHNRFTHSLGVYHLGKIAIDSLRNKSKEKFECIDNLPNIFLYACLLHDVGHAPFSHTGEGFYLPAKHDYTEIHELLKEAVNLQDFTDDIPLTDRSNPQATKAANPHEIMSAIIGIKQFPELFKNAEEKSFFARAIVGYHYKKNSKENGIKNCLIDLLNSKYIDVDKLDYLMRDTYMTGFDSINIDFIRLLNSLDIIIDDTNTAHLVFEKNAISVIENVVYARDLEKKWIQLHPAVLYEIYLLETSIGLLNSKVNDDNLGKKLFSYDALTENGVELNDNISISYLCDDDIIYLLKNKYNFPVFKEFLNRNIRKHPLWKSESEYKSYFISSLNHQEQIRFSSALKQLAGFMKTIGCETINDQVISSLGEEIEKAEKTIENYDALVKHQTLPDQTSLKVSIHEKKEMLYICKPLQEFAQENQIDFNFLLLDNDLFYSAFGNDDFSKIEIIFKKNGSNPVFKLFGDIRTFDAKKIDGNEFKEFYYIFYDRKENQQSFDINELVKKIKRKYIDN